MKKEVRYGKMLYRSISFLLLLIFGISIFGMTYLDSRSMQKEIEATMDRMVSKSEKVLKNNVETDLEQEELLYQTALSMVDVYEIGQESGIGFYYNCKEDGATLLENGNQVFYHFYESYQDKDGDMVYEETMQKILRLDDYFSKDEIKEIVSNYQKQGEEAAMAVEGGYKGLFLHPTSITQLGYAPDQDSIPKGSALWKEKQGRTFYAEQDDNALYYIISEKKTSDDNRVGEYESIPKKVTMECEFSFISNRTQNGIQEKLYNRAKEKQAESGSRGNNTNHLFEVTKSKSVNLNDDVQITYSFTASPVEKAVRHLRFFYLIACFLYIAVSVVIYKIIGIVFKKQEELNQHQKMLTRAIAHELKTPLSIIQGYSEGLKLQTSKEKQTEYIDMIVEETQEMNQLVLDMLELSRLETNGYSYEPEEIELIELLEAVKYQYQSVYKEKNIRVTVEGEEELLITGDLSGMRKVLSNLLANAMKHAPESGIVKITIDKQEKETYLRFFNNGPFIDERVRKHIWDGYYKTSEDNKSMLRNTGLGLTIVKYILEMHGFGYGCQNLEDGVEFYIKIRNDIPENKNEKYPILKRA